MLQSRGWWSEGTPCFRWTYVTHFCSSHIIQRVRFFKRRKPRHIAAALTLVTSTTLVSDDIVWSIKTPGLFMFEADSLRLNGISFSSWHRMNLRILHGWKGICLHPFCLLWLSVLMISAIGLLNQVLPYPASALLTSSALVLLPDNTEDRSFVLQKCIEVLHVRLLSSCAAC